MAVSLMENNIIHAKDLSMNHHVKQGQEVWKTMGYDGLKSYLYGLEKEYLIYKLRENGGSVTKTATAIGVNRTALHNRAAKLDIDIGGVRSKTRRN